MTDSYMVEADVVGGVEVSVVGTVNDGGGGSSILGVVIDAESRSWSSISVWK